MRRHSRSFRHGGCGPPLSLKKGNNKDTIEGVRDTMAHIHADSGTTYLSSKYQEYMMCRLSGEKGQVSRGEEGTDILWDYCLVYRVSSIFAQSVPKQHYSRQALELQ